MLMHNNHNQNIQHYLLKKIRIKKSIENINICKLLRRAGVIIVEINEPVLIEK